MELATSPKSSNKQKARSAATMNPVVQDSLNVDSDDEVELASSSPSSNVQPFHTVDEREYVFSSTFDDWIVKYGVLADHDLLKHGETFVDEFGTLRYTENWQPVQPHLLSDTPSGIREELNATGCLRVPIKIKGAAGSDAPASKALSISFLMNFRALWEYFEYDTVDELAEYAPLFRMYVELFFHLRTTQILLATSLYELVVHLVIDARYTSYPTALSVLNDFTIIFETLLYLALVVLFKGYLFPPERPELHREETHTQHTQRVQRRMGEHRKYTLHWMSSLTQVIHHSWSEFGNIWKTVKETRRLESSNVQKFVPFYDLLNISLKFLTKHTNNIGDKLNLNRKKHNIKLLAILCLLPMYIVIVTFVPPSAPYVNYREVCRDDGNDSYKCLNAQWVFYLTFGYATHMLRRYVFSSAVLLSLTGLSFGAEIAHSLTDSWIYRFGPLRRLGNAGSTASATARSTREERISTTSDIGGVPMVAESPTARGTSPAQPAPSSVLSGARRTSKTVPLEVTMANAATQPPAAFKLGAVPTSEVVQYVQRDSYEHYLFIREFMAIASRSWSPAIVTFVFFACFLIVTFSFLAVAYSDETTTAGWAYYAIWISIRIFVLMLYPIISLAHANAYVYALQEQFLVAAPEDFAVIGGRDSWLEYLDKVPAIWTIYGVWVTWDRLTGLLWTAVAGIGAIVISVASANA